MCRFDTEGSSIGTAAKRMAGLNVRQYIAVEQKTRVAAQQEAIRLHTGMKKLKKNELHNFPRKINAKSLEMILLEKTKTEETFKQHKWLTMCKTISGQAEEGDLLTTLQGLKCYSED